MTETNVFSPLPTGIRDFEIVRRDDPPDIRNQILGGSTFSRYSDVAEDERCAYEQGLYALAMPAGVTSRVGYETLRDALLADLQDALPVDGVLLTLHGAMVADGYLDCESDIVLRVRHLVGNDAKIGVLLDPHCDLPNELVAAADVIVTYKEYPHIDIAERADELARLVIAAIRGRIDPAMATFDCRMVGLYPTTPQPMRGFVDRMTDAEGRRGILSVSLAHGFPWCDSPTTGTRVLVVADGDAKKADWLATELGRDFFSLRHDVSLQASPMTETLDYALSVDSSNRPLVLADVSDNAGGGAASDSTFILRELLDRKAEDAALALLWDPAAVHQAFAVGEGAPLTVRLGGKIGPASGDPIDIEARVRALVPDFVQRWPQANGYIDVPCGDGACLTCGGIDVIVSSVRQQVLSLDVFTAFGINPTERQILVVKSMNHFSAAFSPIAAEIIYMRAPGSLDPDPRAISYQHVDTSQFPWIDDPFSPASGNE